MQNVIIKFALAIFIVFPCLARGEDIDYEARYGRTPVESVPLSFEVNKGKIFLSRVWGLYIVEVECDNKKLDIVDVGIDIDEYEFYYRYTFNTEAKHYTYDFPVGRSVFFAAELGGKYYEDYKMKEIVFPEHWNMLKIKYRVRFADGTFSRDYTARFSRILPPEEVSRRYEQPADHPKEPNDKPDSQPNTQGR